MRISQALGKTITIVGAALFLLFAAALGISLYAKVQSKALSAALMVCATLSAFAFFTGRYLQSAEPVSVKHDEATKKGALVQ
jgi:phosphotransferase system  glucose/maltose/N-acetylglucosamine-specific IIC component